MNPIPVTVVPRKAKRVKARGGRISDYHPLWSPWASAGLAGALVGELAGAGLQTGALAGATVLAGATIASRPLRSGMRGRWAESRKARAARAYRAAWPVMCEQLGWRKGLGGSDDAPKIPAPRLVSVDLSHNADSVLPFERLVVVPRPDWNTQRRWDQMARELAFIRGGVPALSGAVKVRDAPGGAEIALTILLERPERPEPLQRVPESKRMEFVLGMFGPEQIKWCPLDQVSPHLIEVGETGSGKSTNMTLLVAEAVEQGIAVEVIDPKGTDFLWIDDLSINRGRRVGRVWPGSPDHMRPEPEPMPDDLIRAIAGDATAEAEVAKTVAVAKAEKAKEGDTTTLTPEQRDCLRRHLTEMMRRFEVMRSGEVMVERTLGGKALSRRPKQVSELTDQQRRRHGLDYRILVIDEMPSIADDREAMHILRLLTQLGRAAGIHVVIGMQRADTKILDGFIRHNVNARIMFGIGDVIAARMIFGDHRKAEEFDHGLPLDPGIAWAANLGRGWDPRRLQLMIGLYLDSDWLLVDEREHEEESAEKVLGQS